MMQKVDRRLRDTGVIVDTTKLGIEVKHPEQAKPDLVAQLELGLRSDHLEILWNLREILESTPTYRSVALLREDAVAARLSALQTYYAHERRTMVFLDGAGDDEERLEVALAGQLVYASYDQSPGGLAELLYEPRGLLDGIRVRRCLVEGHARLTELSIRHRDLDALDMQSEAELDSVPQHLHGTLSETRCAEGARYLYARYRAGGWESVLRAVRSPLPSTEQLLHPSKVDQDFPVNVALPGWPKDEYGAEEPFGEASMVYEDVLGEQTIGRLLLERGIEPRQAQVAAIGWDGDRLQIYTHENGGQIYIWRSVWDRDLDAEQFATAIAPKGIAPRAFRVQRHGRVVDAISSADPELAARLHGELSQQLGEPTGQPSDGATTAAIEARLSSN